MYDDEPLPADHPLRGLPNTVLTPHTGYVTRGCYEIFYREIVEDIAAWRAGRARAGGRRPAGLTPSAGDADRAVAGDARCAP